MALKLAVVSAASLLLAAGCATTNAPSGPTGAPGRSAAETPVRPSGKPAFKLADLEGRDAKALDALLGEPALVRREGKGEFRRYTLADCSLIVILYPDEKGAERVAHLESAALVSEAPKPDLERCLAVGKPA